MRKLIKAAAILAGSAGAAVGMERLVAAPHYQGPITDHFDGRHFHNIGQPVKSTNPDATEQGSFLQWQLTREPGFWPRWIESDRSPKPEERVGKGRMRVTLINHATMLLQVDGMNILTDPIWSERCSPVGFIGPKRHRAPAIAFDDLPPIDLVLVSHNHYDHLDIPTLRRLQTRHAPRVLTPLGNARLMARHGVAATEADWWSAVRFSEHVVVSVVPARHFCARAISDRNANLWGGFVIQAASGTAYFAGDTGWGSHFERIAERYAPIRLAMLPIGAYLPRWFMQSVHIDPAQAVDAHLALGAATSVAMHYGTFHLGDDGEQEPVADLRIALDEKHVSTFQILDHGVGFDV